MLFQCSRSRRFISVNLTIHLFIFEFLFQSKVTKSDTGQINPDYDPDRTYIVNILVRSKDNQVTEESPKA